MPRKFRRVAEHQLGMICKTIQNRREKLGLTQEELAENLDISPITVQFIEQGRRFPSLPMLFYICGFLGLRIEIG